MTSFELKLPGFKYGDIYEAARLPVLDELFLRFLADRDRLLGAQFRTYRNGAEIGAVAESGLLIEVGRCLEDFLVDAFGVEAARNGLRRQQLLDEPVHAFKEKFIKPRVRRKRAATRSFQILDELLEQKLDTTQCQTDRELAVAQLWVLATESGADEILGLLEEWAYAAYNTPEGRARVAD